MSRVGNISRSLGTDTNTRIKATAEVLTIWTLVVLGFRAIRASYLGTWEEHILGHYLFGYLLVLLLPLFWLFISRRRLPHYGFSLRATHSQVRALATCALPMLLISAALLYIGWQRWQDALLISILEVALLIGMAWLLRDRAAPARHGPTVACLVAVGASNWSVALAVSGATIGRLIFGLMFVALGEEVLFRGYIQSRLNEARGQPRDLWGVRWGWGAVIAALLFGLWHVLNPWNPFSGASALAWSWGLWTFFLGLILSYVRERTGALWVPVFLHWLINL